MSLNFFKEQRADLLTTALEGGSNYWYFLSDESIEFIRNNSHTAGLSLCDRMMEAIYNGASIPIYDIENPDEKLGEINIESMNKAEEIMFNDFFSHYSDARQEVGDAETADVWFQLSVLGELTFG